EPGDRWRPLWSKLAQMGVVGLTAPESCGGLGLSDLDFVLLVEEAGRAAMPGPIVETTAVALPSLGELEPAPRAAAGDAIVAVGLHGDEAGFGADADALLLTTGDELHLVERAAVTVEPVRSVDGLRRLAAVSWQPAPSTRIGGHAELQDARDRGALAVAAQLCGVAAHLIEVTVEYAKQRHQFGVPIGTFQAVKHHCANAALALEYARPLVYRGAYSMSRHDAERSIHVSMAKAYASDAARLAARVALQVHGAIGYTAEHDLQLWMKRAWSLSAAWGDAAFHRRRVSDAVFGPG
ncbi:MAG: acyl-CoA dehydrogenase family protein, partial [Actinobacteria bacterium]|nr:acyl-CoA dehydrogenase family protein [Actinomycetota bacterium]